MWPRLWGMYGALNNLMSVFIKPAKAGRTVAVSSNTHSFILGRSCCVNKTSSVCAGRMFPIGPDRRRFVNQTIQPSVAISRSCMLRHGPLDGSCHNHHRADRPSASGDRSRISFNWFVQRSPSARTQEQYASSYQTGSISPKYRSPQKGLL